ncbi:LysR family transcriptional regulator [Microlunatus soli]|uniref:DNA-binding transcriptional regulator, LysR family n=1 Tax=Microlunatus soli TaxID=630515 RepID=A0A1H1U758_9ACTN|nr:LysR family transcriptional regulator [Microlunatus soli]SDS68274.1 DNA-binding transcriptional regulator, LysR family [Microlunatus soli]
MAWATGEPPAIVWLVSFVAVVEHGTFTAAAQSLNRAQPRVSAHIAALERQLGSALLVRRPRRVELTSAGAAYLPHARAVLRELRGGTDAVSALTSTVQGRVAVGGYPGVMAVVIAPLVRRFGGLYPGVAIELREADPAGLEALVAAGEIDLAVRTVDVPQRHHNVPSTPLFAERIQLIVTDDHPLARAGVADPAALAGRTVIVSGDPLSGWSDYRERLDRIGVEPRQVITVSEPTTVVALVREGLGIGLLGALAAKVTVSDDTTAVDLPEPLWLRQISVYRLATNEPTPAAAAFLELLTEEGPVLTAGRAVWGGSSVTDAPG